MADWSYTPPKRKPFDIQHDNVLPKNWKTIRARQLKREPRCEYTEGNVRCVEPADEVDHVKPRFERGDNEKLNLQSLCAYHHAKKLQARAIAHGRPTRPRLEAASILPRSTR